MAHLHSTFTAGFSTSLLSASKTFLKSTTVNFGPFVLLSHWKICRTQNLSTTPRTSHPPNFKFAEQALLSAKWLPQLLALPPFILGSTIISTQLLFADKKSIRSTSIAQ
ncbi:hypothetical protein PM082_014904 [Marasmius tenuissimus]|nr:hypothetical protein PM082_014904 [Marasmius tenuissimus]